MTRITDPKVLEERRARMFAKLDADVKRVGWSFIGVMTAEGDEPFPPFGYTVGLTGAGHPELLITGVGAPMGHAILGGLYDRVKAGERFEDGQEVDEVLVGYKVRMRAVPAPGYPLNMARAYYDEDVEALQVVWPDAEHHFPGDEGYAEDARQPLADGTKW
jgi:hypothetical protein